MLKSGYKLKGTSFGINRQFPGEIEEARRSLNPILRNRDRKEYSSPCTKQAVCQWRAGPT